eukprot:CAMPEP_0194545952 /NCGR_PEP_ID=MMETSP0253-20130528/89944_1 /TAXON_ID=2966 /ORGANISM="Noctiluca scintillans" /LENGTH=56 /DNA_ID=CAMNT_0039392999 /DNA_START=199 /DNA_END=366 /DNA_ORIENTATION=-
MKASSASKATLTRATSDAMTSCLRNSSFFHALLVHTTNTLDKLARSDLQTDRGNTT